MPAPDFPIVGVVPRPAWPIWTSGHHAAGVSEERASVRVEAGSPHYDPLAMGVPSLAIRSALPVGFAERDALPPLEQELPRSDFR